MIFNFGFPNRDDRTVLNVLVSEGVRVSHHNFKMMVSCWKIRGYEESR